MDRSHNATVSSTQSVARFNMPQPYPSVVTRCSENQATRDYNLNVTRNVALMPPLIQVTPGDAAAKFTSEVNENLPLNLSLAANHKIASEIEQREAVRRHSLVPQARQVHVEIPWCRGGPTDETIATHKEKLIVRGKIYDIVPVGAGLWLLNGDSDF